VKAAKERFEAEEGDAVGVLSSMSNSAAASSTSGMGKRGGIMRGQNLEKTGFADSGKLTVENGFPASGRGRSGGMKGGNKEYEIIQAVMAVFGKTLAQAIALLEGPRGAEVRRIAERRRLSPGNPAAAVRRMGENEASDVTDSVMAERAEFAKAGLPPPKGRGRKKLSLRAKLAEPPKGETPQTGEGRHGLTRASLPKDREGFVTLSQKLKGMGHNIRVNSGSQLKSIRANFIKKLGL
jgi:hypothetical protein